MVKFLLSLVIIFFIFTPKIIYAQARDQFITLVNPIRVSSYSQDPAASLNNQYTLIKNNNLAASWLFTFDALDKDELIEVIKLMDKNQDIGIFMEITEDSAQKAGITYNQTDSWHRANSIFLSGYSMEQRIRFIDSVFNKFKEQLGYYPTSVGAWSIDSYSLEYMQKKYGITANLVCADQFETDGYTFWGQYWAYPYYPSKLHSLIPGIGDNKINVVNIQWAPRDPLNGYLSPSGKRASLYSTQDYYTNGLDDDYFEKLINLYGKKHTNLFGQITFGLEGDFNPETYLDKGQYAKYIQIAKKMQDTGEFKIINMEQFSDWFRQKLPDGTPNYSISSDDFLGTNKNSIWYLTPNYRVGLIVDKQQKKLSLFDLHIYPHNFQDPFSNMVNDQLDLYLTLPSVINGIYPESILSFDNTELVSFNNSSDTSELVFSDNRKITFNNKQIIFENFVDLRNKLISSYTIYKKSNNIQTITLKSEFPFSNKGYLFRGLTLEAEYFLKQKKVIIALTILTLVFIVSLFLIWKRTKRRKLFISIIFLIIMICLSLSFYKYSKEYYVSQSEVDALLNLKKLPTGKVLIADSICLQCSYQSTNQPAVFANKRSYVQGLSGKSLIFDKGLIEVAADNFHQSSEVKKEQARDYLKQQDVKYIYLVKHQDYLEKIPYSPGDINAARIFVNSDAEIWRIKQ